MTRVTSDGFFSYAPASNTASSTDIVDELDLLLTAGHMGADSKAIIRGEYDTTLAVMDPQSCREAAIAGFPDRPIATAFSYVDTHPRSHTPKGCSLRNQPGNEWNNMVYYNTHPTGTGTAGGSECDRSSGWQQFDLDVVTTLVMMRGHPITVQVNGAVTVTDPATWPLSELICSAHASDTRVLVTVLADKGKGPTGHSDPTGRYYQNLLGNATAVLRMADELTALVGAAGFDGVEFDFESIESEMTSNSPDPSLKFDFGAAHVAMIKQVSKTLKASQPHATVALTMGASNLTDPLARDLNKCYPVRELSLAADQIFIMAVSSVHASGVKAHLHGLTYVQY